MIINKNSTCFSGSSQPCAKQSLVENCGNKDTEISQDTPICMPEKSKVILLIIDAFRYDFALYNDYLEYPLPYENKMPFINESITRDPKRNRLYKFIADPPTTTMQRLKALTTGSLPTFIDAGSNFASTEVVEDNILNQLVSSNKNIVFLGDDTWMNMYPNYFLRSYPYPSFNVWDLDTVDTGITSNIYKELENEDWNLLIGHYLGVDHCGHRYGPNHPEMARKLKEMNDVLQYVKI
ncbi:phosphatidylinositol glycan [Holotrichia oblita]|uniref:Phosphatidylinositol glycan n=2 Tax=Holotrichia oblita TaxID=644536 RepID=A0ACB9TE39_HOLOL|nr:phosphatidylinositol glycan [Holotrichia oblita]KAI4467980.1 phosphatidylinositol glycan [Holotrichia oblita]